MAVLLALSSIAPFAAFAVDVPGAPGPGTSIPGTSGSSGISGNSGSGNSGQGLSSPFGSSGNLSPGLSGVSGLSDPFARGLTGQPPLTQGPTVRRTGATSADSHCEWYYKFNAGDATFLGPKIIDVFTKLTRLENPKLSGKSAKDFDILELACLEVEFYK